jgi:hypothetical protein
MMRRVNKMSEEERMRMVRLIRMFVRRKGVDFDAICIANGIDLRYNTSEVSDE